MAPAVRAITALSNEEAEGPALALTAFQAACDLECLDSFVTAYRAFPPLLATLTLDDESARRLADVLDQAGDTALGAMFGAPRPRTRSGTKLTRRETEVCGLLSQGLSNKEIAKTLFISESTAKVHVRHILESSAYALELRRH